MRRAVLVGMVLALAATACDRRSRPRLHVTKERLVRLPTAWRRPSINVADDGRHVTFSVRAKGGYYVVTPDGRTPTYPDVSSPLFAPESDRVSHWGIHEQDGQRRFDVVAGGTVTPTPIVDPIDLVVPTGGARWAAAGLLAADPTAGPEAPRTAMVFVDGREVGRYAGVSRPGFSPDGAHVAWLAREESGRAVLVVDGAVARGFDAAPPSPGGQRFDRLAVVRYLADGRILALAPDGDGWALFRGEERLAQYAYNLLPGTILIADANTQASIVGSSLVTARKAPVAVWWERMPGQAERWRVVRDGAAIDGMTCDHWWETEPPVLTEDGVHVAYVCAGPPELGVPLGPRTVVLDGRRFGPYMDTWTLGLAFDGVQVAYGAAESLPVRSWRVFANGIPRTPPEEVTWRPRFSPDDAHVFWEGGPERGRPRIGMDDRMITQFDDVMYGPEFPDAHTAVWVVRRALGIWRIEARY